MTTKEQIAANQQNALFSTGATSEEGKIVVSKNAVKHGIFTRDLVINKGDGQESLEEYQEILANLTQDLQPQGQLEHLLVEKICVDFWRLRRAIRFETGNIRFFLDSVLYDYSKSHEESQTIDSEIAKAQEAIQHINNHVQLLKKQKEPVLRPFSRDMALYENLVDQLVHVLWFIIESDGNPNRLLPGYLEKMTAQELKSFLDQQKYTDEEVSVIKLIDYLRRQAEKDSQKLSDLQQKKMKLDFRKESVFQMNNLPQGDTQEKVIRYESSIQKSIFQNLLLLKKLQASQSRNGFVL